MLRSGLKPAHYLSPAVLAAEQGSLFRSLWIFAGFGQVLRSPNAFLTRDIGGIPVIVQNIDGELRAFENLCAHRQMALQWEPYGNRALVCRYHGWAYDGDGCVKGIPNAGLYRYAEAERAGLCLRRFAVRSVGNLVFVNLAARPLPIEEQFHAEFLESLGEASALFDDEIIHTSFPAAWNWKLNFENVLDPNHIQFIHSKTFYPLLGDGGEPAQPSLSPKILPIHAQMQAGAPVDLRDLSYAVHTPVAGGRPSYGDLVERYGELDDYYNWFIFPDVNFCSVHGQMFLLQQFSPIAPDLTDFHLTVTSARRRDPDADLTALLRELIHREKIVIDEDGVALSALQRRLHMDAPSASHGDYESHIVRMLRWYAGAVAGAAA
jgi:phenylpropionate dioxygenase-like ring-hydroxylating dioxygenase large terminal subunit